MAKYKGDEQHRDNTVNNMSVFHDVSVLCELCRSCQHPRSNSRKIQNISGYRNSYTQKDGRPEQYFLTRIELSRAYMTATQHSTAFGDPGEVSFFVKISTNQVYKHKN